MQGVIKCISKKKQRAAALTELGYTVFDLIYGEVHANDVISGDLNAHGRRELTNLTTTQTLSVYIEAIQATTANAQSLLSGR